MDAAFRHFMEHVGPLSRLRLAPTPSGYLHAGNLFNFLLNFTVARSRGARLLLRIDDLDWEKRRWQGGWRAYGTAKLATILFIAELAEQLTGTGVTAYSFHPGTIATNFGNTSPLIRFGHLVTRSTFGIPVAEGALPLLHLAGPAPVGAPSGTYFDRLTANGRTNPQAQNAQLGRDLWAASLELVGLGVAA